MILKLSNLEVGKLNSSDISNTIKNFAETLKRTLYQFEGKCQLDYSHRLEILEKITYTYTFELDELYFHANYLTYLEKCWGKHFGIVITPDIMWYTILSELAIIIKNSPETYRHLFSNSDMKETIYLTPSDDILKDLSEILVSKASMDAHVFFPELNYTKNSKTAFRSVFCDICSPYYDYCLLLCGFPSIDIKGTIDDWKLVKEHWSRLNSLVKNNKGWVKAVDKVLNDIIENFSNSDFWKEIFTVKKCGSGHQSKVSGWFIDLFVTKPELSFTRNFSTHISNVKYTDLMTKQQYEINVGLFSSTQKGEFMEPNFSSVIYNTTEHNKIKNL